MADLNNTIVRGKLRVTEDINANGSITGSSATLSSVKNAGILGTDSSGKVYNNSSAYIPYDNASKDIYLGSYGIHSGTRPSSDGLTLMGNGYWIKPSSVGVSSKVIGGTVPSESSEMTPDCVSISNGKIKLNTSGIVSDGETFTFDGNPGSVATSVDINNLQTALNGKANSSHTHSISQITNLQKSLDGKTSKSDVSNIIESTLKKKNKIYVLSSVTLDTGIYLDSGNREFANKSAVLQFTMSEPGDSWAGNLYLITGNEEERVYPSELLLGDIIMTKDPEYPMRIITNIIRHTNNNGLLTSTTFTCTAVNSNDINHISQPKKENEYFYRNSNSCVAAANQDFGTKFGYVLLGTFNSSNSGSINIHATYGDSQKRSTIEMTASFDSSGKPTGYYTGTEPNYDDGYCSLMTAPTESDTSKLGLYMRLRGNVTYTIVINMPTPKNGGPEESKKPFSIVNRYTMIYNDSS